MRMRILPKRQRLPINNKLTRDMLIEAIRVHTPSIALLGCGALGSNIGMLISAYEGWRSIALYDRDTVEEGNIATQVYSMAEVGERKIDALARAMQWRRPNLPISKYGYDLANHRVNLADITIAALDSFAIRKRCFERTVNSPETFFISPAVSAAALEVWCGMVGLRRSEANPAYRLTAIQRKSYLAAQAHEEDEHRGCDVGGTMSHTSAICAGMVMECIARYVLGEQVPAWQSLDLRTMKIAQGFILGKHDATVPAKLKEAMAT